MEPLALCAYCGLPAAAHVWPCAPVESPSPDRAIDTDSLAALGLAGDVELDDLDDWTLDPFGDDPDDGGEASS